MPVLRILRSNTHIITATHKGVIYKLFRIDFGKDGSIYLSFPYYKHTDGIVAEVVMPPSATGKYESLSLAQKGKCTSHLVKHSHHTSGESLFSMTGKVKTEIRKQSVPLGRLNGHFFTLMIQGLGGFEDATGEKDTHGWTKKRSVANFDLVDEVVNTIKFVGVWQSLASFTSGKSNFPAGTDFIGPKFCYKASKSAYGFLLGTSEGNIFNQYILSLRASLETIIDEDRQTAVVFIGGFDDPNKVNNLNEESSFLSMLYPADKPEELLKEIGSIDLEKQ